MSLKKQIVIRWSIPAIPVYNLSYEQIARPLMLSDGIVSLDGSDLVKLGFEGKLLWRCPHNYGFWGSPVHLKANGIVCASGDNKVNFIDEAGNIVQTTNLPTSVSTDIVVSNTGDLWFGIGAAECAVTRVDANGNVIYTQYVARDQGLRHPLTLAVDGSLWVPTDQGLVRLDSESGKILTWMNVEKSGFGCISEALPCPDGVLVVAVMPPDCSCAVTKVANDGTILAQYSLPPLLRARLISAPCGGAWLVGSTVSPWEPPLDSDRTFIARLTPDGKPMVIAQVLARRFIEATVDSDGNLWVGTYTYDDDNDSESGELLICEEGVGTPYTAWISTPPAGVGAVVLRSKGYGVMATSQAVIGFTADYI